MYHNGTWGTVCGNGWDLNDAEVVCRELNFGPAISAKNTAFYEQCSNQICLDSLNCTGTELTIGDCSHKEWRIHNCDHNKVPGVRCAASNGNLFMNVQFGIRIYYC